jgi:hypothetical protein
MRVLDVLATEHRRMATADAKEKAKRQHQLGLGADRVARLVPSDLVDRPGMKSARRVFERGAPEQAA